MRILSGAILTLAGAVALAGGAIAEGLLVNGHRSVGATTTGLQDKPMFWKPEIRHRSLGLTEISGYSGLAIAVIGLGVTGWGAFSGESRFLDPR